MTTTRRHEGSRSAYLGAVLAAHAIANGQTANPFWISLAVEDMQRGTRAARRWATNLCNYSFTEAQEARGFRRINRLQHDTMTQLDKATGWHPPLASNLRAVVEFGGDPRGPCGRLHIPGQRGDGWGEGFAIYQEGAR